MRRFVLPMLLMLGLFRLAVAPAWADAASGPERTTVITQDWGTIYHLPFSLDTHMSEDVMGEYTINSRRETWSIKQLGVNEAYLIYYPDKSVIEVRRMDANELRVEVQGKRSYFRRNSSGWVMRLPNDEIRLQKKGNQVRISGKLGTTVVVDEPNGFTVTSAAGETRYARADFDQPFKLSGVPIQSHPYVVRGVWFERDGLGAFVDFKLSDYSRAFTMLGWYPMITFDGN